MHPRGYLRLRLSARRLLLAATGLALTLGRELRGRARQR